VSQFTLTNFSIIALAEFPELREEFDDFDELPFVQMGVLARLIQGAKGRGDWETYGRAAHLADRLWGGADAGLHNALNVSFLEHIDFDGSRGPQAWALLSPRLQQAWRVMTAYNEWVHSGARGQPPAGADV
jgi:hypothetical protein